MPGQYLREHEASPPVMDAKLARRNYRKRPRVTAVLLSADG